MSDTAGHEPIRVPIDGLNIDTRYQRSLKPAHVRQIAQNYRPGQFQPLYIAQRPDGSRWIIDGQQRHAAALSLGLGYAWATIIHTDGTSKDEARMFVQCNTLTRTVTAAEVHRSKVAYEDPTALTIESVLGDRDLTALLDGDARKRVPVVEPLYRVMERRDGAADLAWALDSILPWYSDEGHRPRDVFQARLLGGLFELASRYRGDVEAIQVSAILTPMTPAMVLSQIETRGNGSLWNAYAESLRSIINDKTQRDPLMP